MALTSSSSSSLAAVTQDQQDIVEQQENIALRSFFHTAIFGASLDNNGVIAKFDLVVDNAKSRMRTASTLSPSRAGELQCHRSKRKNFSSSKCRWSATDTRRSPISTNTKDTTTSTYSKKLDVAMTLPRRMIARPTLPRKADVVMALPTRIDDNTSEDEKTKNEQQKKKKGRLKSEEMDDMLRVYQFLEEALAMLPSSST